MKAIINISLLTILTLGSCTSALYTGAEYDDLYYIASDKPVVNVRPPANNQISDQKLNSGEYYDNIYAADTLVADEYADAVDINNQIVENNNYDNGYEYYDNYSYTGRLRRFYGNYFDPYWRDPFYFDFGYSYYPYAFSFGYGGFPYNYGFGRYNYWNRYYGFGYGGYYNYYDSYYYGYSPFYYGGGYGWSPYFGNAGRYYAGEGRDYVQYGRNERASNLSSRWNSSTGASGAGRRDSYLSTGSNSESIRRSASGSQTIATDQRRNPISVNNSQTAKSQDASKSVQSQSGRESISSGTPANTRSAAASKPSYSEVNRSYTPSYISPRMSTRPAYNNSRVSESVNPGASGNTNAGTVRTPVNQGTIQNSGSTPGSNPSTGTPGRRVESSTGYSAPSIGTRSNVSTNRSSGSYSVPSRSGVETRSSFSGSSNNSTSVGRSSASSSSSSSGSRSSFSSGSSSSASSSSSSSGSSRSSSSGSSSGRR